VIEIPPLLPLDAHMRDEEEQARILLERAGATADSYGIGFTPRIVRSRKAGDTIVEQARAEATELVVVGVRRRGTSSLGASAFGGTVKRVLEGSPCRVMIVTPEAPGPGLRAAAG
jgi:nucleotide-binding universal stress UspA family protein